MTQAVPLTGIHDVPVRRGAMPEPQHPYAGRRAVVATMHGKEAAIAPPLLSVIGLHVVTAPALDTDQLGTFSGEISRQGTMLEVAVRKARLGMREAGLPLGIASEGTFGPHPTIPFLPAGLELIVLVDDERNFVVHESLIAEGTNLDHLVVSPGEPLDPFLERVGFPAHGLMVRTNVGDAGIGLTKGVIDRQRLDRAIRDAAAMSADGRALLETDMRAHLNPTRMTSLADLAGRLARRLATLCPARGAPGFGRTGTRSGLTCETCNSPTTMVAAETLGCQGCAHREERPRRDGMRTAPAQFCAECNP